MYTSIVAEKSIQSSIWLVHKLYFFNSFCFNNRTIQIYIVYDIFQSYNYLNLKNHYRVFIIILFKPKFKNFKCNRIFYLFVYLIIYIFKYNYFKKIHQ